MSATSGSPTQVKTSVSTAADLAGTPDDAFKEGDLACVTALWPNSTFRLRRTALVGAADNVTSIETFSGNGYWEVFAAGGNTLVFANIAALAAFNDAGLGDGAEVYVQSVRSYFAKRILAPAPAGDSITVVPTLSGDGAFYRVAMPRMWEDEDVFYVDEASGNDENDGLTVLTALATLGEVTRRTYMPGETRIDYRLFVGPGGVTSGSDWLIACNVDVRGVSNPIHIAQDITAVVQAKKTTVCARQVLTAPALTFGAYNRLELTNNLGNDQQGWAVSAKDDPVANAAYTEIFEGTSVAVLDDTYLAYEYELPQFFANVTATGGTLQFLNLVVSGTVTNASVRFRDSVLGSVDDSLEVRNSFPTFDGCKASPDNQVTISNCTEASFEHLVIPDGGTVVLDKTVGYLLTTCAIVGGVLELGAGSRLTVDSDLELTDNAVLSASVSETSIAFMGPIYIWGVGGALLEMPMTNTRVTYDSGSTWTSTGTYSHPDGAGGSTTANLITLPAAPSVAAMPTHAVGIFQNG